MQVSRDPPLSAERLEELMAKMATLMGGVSIGPAQEIAQTPALDQATVRDPRADLEEQLHRLLIKINHDVTADNFERLPLLNMEWMRLKGLYDSMKKQYE